MAQRVGKHLSGTWRQRTAGLLTATLLLAAQSAPARQVVVRVIGPQGKPLQYAAVQAAWPGASMPKPAAEPAEMYQHDLHFVPHMLIVPMHSEVTFPNRDKTRHHVYSFSRAKTFDIKLYVGLPKRAIAFDTPGVVTLGCNIHDQMQAFIIVSDAPRAAISDGAGYARLNDLPDRPVTLSIWHPWMDSEQARVTRTVAADDGDPTVRLTVTSPPPPRSEGPNLQNQFDKLAR